MRHKTCGGQLILNIKVNVFEVHIGYGRKTFDIRVITIHLQNADTTVESNGNMCNINFVQNAAYERQ